MNNESGNSSDDDQEFASETDKNEDNKIDIFDGIEEDDQCPVCLNDFIEQWVAIPDGCSHLFCLDCLLEWGKNSTTCPVDRIKFEYLYVYDKLFGTFQNKIQVTASEAPQDSLDTVNCQICGSDDNEDTLLLCDGCDLGYHCACLDRPLSEVPFGEWFCNSCRRQHGTGEDEVVDNNTRVLGRTRAVERVRAEIQESRSRRHRSTDGDLRSQIDRIVDDILRSSSARLRISEGDGSRRRRHKVQRRKKGKTRRKKSKTRSKKNKPKCSSLWTSLTRDKKGKEEDVIAETPLYLFGSELTLDSLSESQEETPSYLIARKHRQLSAAATRFNLPLPSLLTAGSRSDNVERSSQQSTPDVLSHIINEQDILAMPSTSIHIQRNGFILPARDILHKKQRPDLKHTTKPHSSHEPCDKGSSNDKSASSSSKTSNSSSKKSEKRQSYSHAKAHSGNSSVKLSSSGNSISRDRDDAHKNSDHFTKTIKINAQKSSRKIKIKLVTNLPRKPGEEKDEVYDPFNPTDEDNTEDLGESSTQGTKHVYDPFEPTLSDEEHEEVSGALAFAESQKIDSDEKEASDESVSKLQGLLAEKTVTNDMKDSSSVKSSELTESENKDVRSNIEFDMFADPESNSRDQKVHSDEVPNSNNDSGTNNIGMHKVTETPPEQKISIADATEIADDVRTVEVKRRKKESSKKAERKHGSQSRFSETDEPDVYMKSYKSKRAHKEKCSRSPRKRQDSRSDEVTKRSSRRHSPEYQERKRRSSSRRKSSSRRESSGHVSRRKQDRRHNSPSPVRERRKKRSSNRSPTPEKHRSKHLSPSTPLRKHKTKRRSSERSPPLQEKSKRKQTSERVIHTGQKSISIQDSFRNSDYDSLSSGEIRTDHRSDEGLSFDKQDSYADASQSRSRRHRSKEKSERKRKKALSPDQPKPRRHSRHHDDETDVKRHKLDSAKDSTQSDDDVTSKRKSGGKVKKERERKKKKKHSQESEEVPKKKEKYVKDVGVHEKSKRRDTTHIRSIELSSDSEYHKDHHRKRKHFAVGKKESKNDSALDEYSDSKPKTKSKKRKKESKKYQSEKVISSGDNAKDLVKSSKKSKRKKSSKSNDLTKEVELSEVYASDHMSPEYDSSVKKKDKKRKHKKSSYKNNDTIKSPPPLPRKSHSPVVSKMTSSPDMIEILDGSQIVNEGDVDSIHSPISASPGVYSPDSPSRSIDFDIKTPSPAASPLLSTNDEAVSECKPDIEETLSCAEKFLEQSRKRWRERQKITLKAPSLVNIATKPLSSTSTADVHSNMKQGFDGLDRGSDGKKHVEQSNNSEKKDGEFGLIPVCTSKRLSSSDTDHRILIDATANDTNRFAANINTTSSVQDFVTRDDTADDIFEDPQLTTVKDTDACHRIETVSGISHGKHENSSPFQSDQIFDNLVQDSQSRPVSTLIEVPMSEATSSNETDVNDISKEDETESCAEKVHTMSTVAEEPDKLPTDTEADASTEKKTTEEPEAKENDVATSTEKTVLNPTQILNSIGLNPQQKSEAQNAILSIAELSKHLQLDKLIKAKISKAQANADSPSVDTIESSAVEMYNKGKRQGFMKKVEFQEKVAEEAKQAIKPYYERREISKTEYKEILKRAVNKICTSESSMEVNIVKTRRLIRRYIEKYQQKNSLKRDKIRSKLSDAVSKRKMPDSPEPPKYQPLMSPKQDITEKVDYLSVGTPNLLKREPRKVVTLPDLPLPPPPPPPPPRQGQL